MNLLMLAAGMLNPGTGDNTDLLLKIVIVAGILCVLCLAALLILPKVSKKEQKPEEEEIEVIDQE